MIKPLIKKSLHTLEVYITGHTENKTKHKTKQNSCYSWYCIYQNLTRIKLVGSPFPLLTGFPPHPAAFSETAPQRDRHTMDRKTEDREGSGLA